MALHRSPNPVLERLVADLGGTGALAALLWPAVPSLTRYRRLYRWRVRGRVPARWLGHLVAVARAAGLAGTPDVTSLSPPPGPPRAGFSNPALERAVDAAGGHHALAALLWPAVCLKARYDRLYSWRARGRVPAASLGRVVAVMRRLGLSVADDVISILGGTAPRPPGTSCRQLSSAVKARPTPVRRDAA